MFNFYAPLGKDKTYPKSWYNATHEQLEIIADEVLYWDGDRKNRVYHTTIKEDADVVDAAKMMLDKQVTHIPVVTDDYKLIGIVTSWDLSKSIATGSNHLKDIMTTTVKYCYADDSIESVARMMSEYDISSLPVVDEDMKVLGIVTTDQISHLLG